MKRFERRDLARPFDGLTDGDEGRHVGVLRTERLRDHRAQMRHRHRLRRDVAGVPVILMPRVQDEPEIGGVEGSDDGTAIDHARDLLEALCEPDVVHRRRDAGERTQHLVDSHARLERRVALRIERLGLRHAAGHPQHDHGVGRRLAWRCFGTHEPRFTPHQRRQRRRGSRPHEFAPAHPRVDQSFFGGHHTSLPPGFFYRSRGPTPARSRCAARRLAMLARAAGAPFPAFPPNDPCPHGEQHRVSDVHVPDRQRRCPEEQPHGASVLPNRFGEREEASP